MPKKDLPRYQMANWVVIIAFFFGSVFIGIYQLATKGIGMAWLGFIGVAFLLIPFLLRKIFRLRPAYLMDMVLYVFIFLAYNLGVGLRLYGEPSLWWLDLAAHFLSGFVFTVIGLCIYYYLKAEPERGMGHDRKVAVGFSFCFCQFTAAAWEFIEYSGFVFFGHDSQNMASGTKDTMEDMLMCLAGSVIMSVLIAVHLRGKHHMVLLAPADEFYRANFGQKNEKKRSEGAFKKA